MEAAVVTGILKVVGNKLAPLVINECRSIVGVKKDLQELQDLAKQINSWLEAQGDRAEENWLKKLKDVAYDVDDVVDEFQLEAEKKDADANGGTMSKYCTKPKSFLLQCTSAWKIKDIKKRFAEVVKQRADINAIKNDIADAHPAHHTTVEMEMLPLPTVDASSVIGRDQEKDHIISKLIESKNQQKIKIVSIIGLGGSGKTTLAKLVFNDGNIIAKDFEVRLWVHVSQEFCVQKLVWKLFEAFAEDKSDHRPLQHMSKKISERLSGKRFLLVLDDVWTEDQMKWKEFMVFLNGIIPAPGSRILLTTRNREVAVTVGSTGHFDLPLLSPNDSWQVFQQSIVMPATGWKFQFEEVGNQIVKKCGGLPLAIKVIACALHGKEQIEEWLAIRDNSLLDVVGEENKIFACLKLSYSHLPSHLKPCFTICSLFPKGYMIDKEQLIDQWIAHDMIGVEDGVGYVEYTAHKYFNSLVQRSFLQDVDENSYVRVKCRMHDLVHDLARSILGDKISLVVPKTSSTRGYRYFSLTKQAIHLPPKNLFWKARALYADKCEVDCKIFGKALKNATHLRSITMEYVDKEVLHTAILQVKNLKYLEISRLYGEALPEAISDIWSLQTLHLTFSDLVELPKSIGKLQKLRTLNLFNCEKLKCLPDSIVDCQMISSIDLCNCYQLTLLPSSIGRNKRLRILRLGNTKMERLPPSITALKNLECLDLHKCWELVELPKDIGNLNKLEVLNLTKCENLGGMPVGIGRLSRLQNLGLFALGEGEKFAGISELANLPRIGGELSIRGISHELELEDVYTICLKKMTNLQGLGLEWRTKDVGGVNTEMEQAVLDGLEPPPGIKELNISGYSGRQYAWWMQNQAGSGVNGLPSFLFLRVMTLFKFPNLKHLHGLAELPCLEELVVRAMPCLETISGGPFPFLVKLLMCELPRLEEVWMVAERTMPDGEEGGGCNSCTCTPLAGQVRIGSCLSKLDIVGCPRLKVKPCLPSSLHELLLAGRNELLLQSSSLSQLKKLVLWGNGGLGSGRGWELLQQMTALESLEIQHSSSLIDLPESLGNLTSLRSLHVFACSAIRMLPMSLGDLPSLQELTITICHCFSSFPQSLGRLTSLLVLKIVMCDAFQQLPECLGDLRSLRKLYISGLPGLTCIPQSICHLTSLEELKIWRCPGIKSLPEGVKDLTALQELDILGCPDLARRCERGKGEGWYLISHIPRLQIRTEEA